MKSKHLLSSTLAVLVALLFSATAWGQNSGTVNDAFQTAKSAVKPDQQTKVVSVYGTGTPSAIDKWYIIFYDPTVPTHGRAVLVENKAITKSYPANGGVTYSSALTFDPSRITSEGPALDAAKGYAAKHNIHYDSVTALLHQTPDKPFRWKIGLVDAGRKKGYVYVSALDDSVASYDPSTATERHSSSASSDNSDEGFGNDVKNTFLGIGGDLEEFFTGQRTVDK